MRKSITGTHSLKIIIQIEWETYTGCFCVYAKQVCHNFVSQNNTISKKLVAEPNV